MSLIPNRKYHIFYRIIHITSLPISIQIISIIIFMFTFIHSSIVRIGLTSPKPYQIINVTMIGMITSHWGF